MEVKIAYAIIFPTQLQYAVLLTEESNFPEGSRGFVGDLPWKITFQAQVGVVRRIAVSHNLAACMFRGSHLKQIEESLGFVSLGVSLESLQTLGCVYHSPC